MSWHQAKYDSQNYINVHRWCTEHFGPPPSTIVDTWARWHLGAYDRIIWFRYEKDYAWFMLRWGS